MRKSMTTIALALLWAPSTNAFPLQKSPLTAKVSTSSKTFLSAASMGDNANANDNDSFNLNNNNNFQDWDALDKKNASRKKFGLKPMSVEEFIANEALVQQMTVEQQQRAAAAAAEATLHRQQDQQQQQQQQSGGGFLEKIFGAGILPETCESNFDCEAPKVCCDFGVNKVCCAGGSRERSREGELALVPVPIDVFPEGKY